MKYYTSAPESYDGFGTKTIQENVYRNVTKDQSLRLVEIEESALQWQTMRYSSGNHFYCQENSIEEFDFLFEKIAK